MSYLLERFSWLEKPCNECQARDGHSKQVVELAHIFSSLTMFAFAVLVISFHIELLRINFNHYILLKRRGIIHESWSHLLGHMSRVTHLLHFFLGISVYLSLYYVYIPALALLTFYNWLPYHFKHDVMSLYWVIPSRVAKAAVILFLWIYLYVWTTAGSGILEVYYSEINSAYKLLECITDLVLFFTIFYTSGLLLRYCLLKEKAPSHFRDQITYLENIFENFYLP